MSLGYLAHEVLDVRASFERIVNGQQSDFVYEAEGFGIATPWKRTGTVKRRVKLPLLLGTAAEITSFRKFLARKRGPQRAFWVPVYVSDFDLADAELLGINKLRVQRAGYAAKWAAGDQFRHAALLSPQVLDCHGITAVTTSGTEEILTVTPRLYHTLTLRTILCPLLLVRFSDDTCAFNYSSGNVAQVMLDLIEVPAEVPAPGVAATVNAGSRPLYLYEFTVNGTVTRYCGWGVNVTANSLLWTAENITHGDIRAGLDFIGDTVDLTIRTRNNAHLLMSWINRLNMKNADVQIFETDAGTLTFDAAAPVYAGRIESVEYNTDGQINAACSSLFRAAEARVPRVNIQRTCNHRTFDAGCGLSEAAFTTTGTVSAINADPPWVEAAAFGTKAAAEADPDWFALGKVTIGTEVRLCTGTDGADRLYLNAAFQNAAVSNSVAATAGDNKRVGTCNQKFNNLSNFLGWPYIPSRNPQFRALETPKAPGGKKG